MFFTIVAVVMIIPFLIFYAYHSSVDESGAINARINTMNNFVFSLEQDIPRQLYIAGYRTIFIFEKKISNEGSYISDLNSSFNELFFNRSLNGIDEEIMTGATYEDIKTSMEDMGKNINVNVFVQSNSIRMMQEDPWRIKIVFDAIISVEDSGGLASLNKSGKYYAYIPIESFEDPLYMISTSGLVARKINKTVYNPLVNGEDAANLSLHNQQGLYIASNLAPSFLDRLEGKSSANEFGIESLVYLPELSEQGILVQQKSCVDYIYFSDQNPSSHNIRGMPSWFYLDSGHLNLYNAALLAG
jgi:hypothetical protein